MEYEDCIQIGRDDRGGIGIEVGFYADCVRKFGRRFLRDGGFEDVDEGYFVVGVEEMFSEQLAYKAACSGNCYLHDRCT